MTYQQQITSADQALVHLAFHCSLKDGILQTPELDFLAGSFAAKGLNKSLDLKEEMQHYQAYRQDIRDENEYLHFLFETIHPENKLALFSFCAEIIYGDDQVSIAEEVLLNKIAGLLHVKDSESQTIQDLIAELNDVQKRNAF